MGVIHCFLSVEQVKLKIIGPVYLEGWGLSIMFASADSAEN